MFFVGSRKKRFELGWLSKRFHTEAVGSGLGSWHVLTQSLKFYRQPSQIRSTDSPALFSSSRPLGCTGHTFWEGRKGNATWLPKRLCGSPPPRQMDSPEEFSAPHWAFRPKRATSWTVWPSRGYPAKTSAGSVDWWMRRATAWRWMLPGFLLNGCMLLLFPLLACSPQQKHIYTCFFLQ